MSAEIDIDMGDDPRFLKTTRILSGMEEKKSGTSQDH